MGKYSQQIFSDATEPQDEQTDSIGKYSSKLLSAEQTSVSGGLYDTPTGRSPDPASVPPIEGRGAGFFANLKSGMATDPKTKLRVMAESMFPNEPNAHRRFGYRDGRPVFVNREGRVEFADAGALSRVGGAVANAPEVIGGAIGSAATGNPFTGSIIGSVGGKGVKQMLSGLLFDEPQTAGGNAAGLAEEATVSALGAGVGKGASAMVNRTAVRGADKFDKVKAGETIDRIRNATGIELDFAQAGNVRQLRDLKKWASKYPSDAQEIIEALDQKQADQIANSIRDRLLPKISGKSDTAEMAQSGIDGARAAIQLAKQRRRLETQSAFETAERDLLPAESVERLRADTYIDENLGAVLNNNLYRNEFSALGLLPRRMDSVTNLPISKGPIRPRAQGGSGGSTPAAEIDSLTNLPRGGARDSVTNLPVGERTASPSTSGQSGELGDGTAGLSIKAWDLVYRNIKDAESAAMRSGENYKASLLAKKAKKLEKELTDASPKYAEARAAWSKATQDYVEPLEKGVIGILAKIDSPNVARDAARIMDGEILNNPSVAARVRGELSANGNEEAWQDLVRLSLEKAFQKASKETQSGDAVNMAGKFRQTLIGTPQQKLAMNVALGKNVAPVFGDLMDALGMVAKETRARSDSGTAFNQAITQQQKAGALGSLVRSAMAPLNTARDMIDQRMLENNAKAIAEALTDPKKLAKLKELRALKPSTERAMAMLTAAGLGGLGLGSVADAVSAPADAMPDSGREVLQSR